MDFGFTEEAFPHSNAGNYAWFELWILAYNLMNFFKEEVLNQKKVKNTIQTIRERLFFIPGRLIPTSRRCVPKLEETRCYGKDYEKALAIFTEISISFCV